MAYNYFTAYSPEPTTQKKGYYTSLKKYIQEIKTGWTKAHSETKKVDLSFYRCKRQKKFYSIALMFVIGIFHQKNSRSNKRKKKFAHVCK